MQNQQENESRQPANDPKREYHRPRLRDWGTIEDLTKDQGMTFRTDLSMLGSMEVMSR